VAYAWHNAALADTRAGVEITVTNEPQCGWFKRRLAKGGVYVPARIWLVGIIDPETDELMSDELMACEVAGEMSDVDDEWTYVCQHPITENEFRYMEATRIYCALHEPKHPINAPRTPVNWLTSPIPEF
jgi:hypothetical protein